MCKYFEVVDLEPEVKRLLISEFGSVANAKKDMTIFSFHLPEQLQEQMIQYAEEKFHYIKKDPSASKICFQELNQAIRTILAGLFGKA